MTRLEKLYKKALKTEQYEELAAYCLSAEYQSLPYALKNQFFITSSKLKAFSQCELAYRYRYVDLVEPPHPEIDEKDHFIIGQAFDDLMTSPAVIDKKYALVDRRINNVDKEIDENKQKLEAAKKTFNKNGERSLPSLRAEEQCRRRIYQLEDLKAKTQVTNGMMETIMRMKDEFVQQKMFNQKPKKAVFFWKVRDSLVKAEIDDFDGKVISDIKTSKNVLTFDPESYWIQATLYQLLVEMNLDLKLPVRYEVVDKYTYFARSALVEYTNDTLEGYRGQLLELIDKLINAHETGMFFETGSDEYKMTSPYYGYKDYGRPQQPIFF